MVATSATQGLVVIDPDAPVDANDMKCSAEDLCGVSGIEPKDVAAHDVIATARTDKNAVVVDIIRQIGRHLGQATLSVIFYPHKIALIGGTTTSGDTLLCVS